MCVVRGHQHQSSNATAYLFTMRPIRCFTWCESDFFFFFFFEMSPASTTNFIEYRFSHSQRFACALAPNEIVSFHASPITMFCFATDIHIARARSFNTLIEIVRHKCRRSTKFAKWASELSQTEHVNKQTIDEKKKSELNVNNFYKTSLT